MASYSLFIPWGNRLLTLDYLLLHFRVKSGNEAPWIVRCRIPGKNAFINGDGGSFQTYSHAYGAGRPGNSVDTRFKREKTNSSWTALISRYMNCGQYREALRIYEEMLMEGIKPSTIIFMHALKACSMLKNLESGKKIHAHLIESSIELQTFVASMLLDLYGKCGSMAEARHVFDKLPHRDVVSWNVMILGYAKKEESEVALQLYAKMQQEGVAPKERTFVGVLKACSNLATLEEGTEVDGKLVKARCLLKGRAIHSLLVKGGFESNVFVGTTLLDLYVKCGSMVDARHVFDKLPHRDVVSWTSMILGYAEQHDGEVALQLFGLMQQEGVAPNDRTFVGALKACCTLAALEERKPVDGKILKIGCLEKCRAIYFLVVKAGFELDAFVGTTLMDAFAKCGSIIHARQAFDKLPHRDVVSWSAMIIGYAEQGESEEAFRLFSEMQEQGVPADSWTYVSILKACGNTAALEAGRQVHAHIRRVGLERLDIITSTLIDMYCKCGSMADARQIFDASTSRGLVTWNAMITGFARQGKGGLVFHLLHRMRHEGVEPDGVTLLSVLTTCSHVGLVDKGQDYFEDMRKEYGIMPTIEHYSSMVDLLGRAGQVTEAVAMVEKMPFKPNVVVWTAVLGACRKWNYVGLGRLAFNRVVKMDETNAAAYVLMSNIYADAHMWEECESIQAMKKKARACKTPGQSHLTDIGGVPHTFVVGDVNHPRSKDIYAKLKDLSVKLKETE